MKKIIKHTKTNWDKLRGFITNMEALALCQWLGLFLLFFLLIPYISFAGETINDAFGVNMHLVNRLDSDNWDTVLDLAKDNGVDWVREEFDWSKIEPTDDNYNWEAYDSVIDKYNERDIKVLGLITYSTSWASSNPGSDDYEYYAPDLTAWKDYISNLTEHYAGKVDAWEIWNEPNFDGFWKSETEDYIEILEEAAKKIQAADPNAQIVLGGLSGADSDFLQTIYDQIEDKDYFDVIAIHPYRVVSDNYNYSPEETTDGLNTLQIDLVNIKATAKKNGDKNKPIWLTEFGWSTYDDGVSQKTQANYLSRGQAIALSVPKVKKVFWYNFRDDADNSTYLESNFGLVKNDLTKKESLEVFNFLKNKLTGKKYIQSSLANTNSLDDFNKKTGWRFSGARYADGNLKQAHHGRLKVYYQFNSDTNNSYLPIYRKINMPKRTKALSFKAKGSNDTTYLRVRIKDATGEIFQYNLGYLPKNFLTYRLNLKNYSSHWNGDNDGQLDQPLYFQSFILDDNPDGSQASGYVYFDDLQSSKKGVVYLYKYKAKNKYRYLIWTTGKSRRHTIKLTNVEKIMIRSLNKNILQQSNNNKFSIQVTPRPKLIQVKK